MTYQVDIHLTFYDIYIIDLQKTVAKIEEAYEALSEAHDLLSDNHIHIEFCNINDVGNNESANYSATIWNKDITRY